MEYEKPNQCSKCEESCYKLKEIDANDDDDDVNIKGPLVMVIWYLPKIHALWMKKKWSIRCVLNKLRKKNMKKKKKKIGVWWNVVHDFMILFISNLQIAIA